MADVDREQRIRQRAHEIWEREGRAEGDGDRHWLEAERAVDSENGQASAAEPPTAKKARKAPAKPKATTRSAAGKLGPAADAQATR